jgi:amino acid transporter
MYTYGARSLGPWAGFFVAWLFILFEPLVAPFLYLEFGWAMHEVMSSEAGAGTTPASGGSGWR